MTPTDTAQLHKRGGSYVDLETRKTDALAKLELIRFDSANYISYRGSRESACKYRTQRLTALCTSLVVVPAGVCERYRVSSVVSSACYVYID